MNHQCMQYQCTSWVCIF